MTFKNISLYIINPLALILKLNIFCIIKRVRKKNLKLLTLFFKLKCSFLPRCDKYIIIDLDLLYEVAASVLSERRREYLMVFSYQVYPGTTCGTERVGIYSVLAYKPSQCASALMWHRKQVCLNIPYKMLNKLLTKVLCLILYLWKSLWKRNNFYKLLVETSD